MASTLIIPEKLKIPSTNYYGKTFGPGKEGAKLYSEVDDLNSIRFADFGILSVSNNYNTLEKRLNNITEYINKTYLEVEIVELDRFNLI